MEGTKESGTISEQDLIVHVVKRMQHHLRSSMHQIEDRDFNQENITKRQARIL